MIGLVNISSVKFWIFFLKVAENNKVYLSGLTYPIIDLI